MGYIPSLLKEAYDPPAGYKRTEGYFQTILSIIFGSKYNTKYNSKYNTNIF